MESKEILKNVVEAADNKKAEEIVALDVHELSYLADYFVIMQADSTRQVKAIADNIEEAVEEAGIKIKQIEGKNSGNWILIDLYDVVVHVFKTETRQFYNLEKLWADAPLVELSNWITE
ncbi:ribosome silencing factor [Liquorilactobacillus satsumensis]|uniref:ribosome silencing factor n=1 Tax=Liquorilactobacillus satsumensis TaxID=259059 RepID=UPI0021C333FD|nr:ribosome silencing factor [Liquorilactobacillus satsumensis]MCP9311876.1 ribosome silencing factor [Liquorilactobacillus satsumensis]MCP9359009.1 ribosome silencing factor [Liquorilactobacillus satsumensis]